MYKRQVGSAAVAGIGGLRAVDSNADVGDPAGVDPCAGVDFKAVADIVESSSTGGDGVTSTGGGEASVSGVLCADTVGGTPTDAGAADDGVKTSVAGNVEAPSVSSGVDDIAVGVYVLRPALMSSVEWISRLLLPR